MIWLKPVIAIGSAVAALGWLAAVSLGAVAQSDVSTLRPPAPPAAVDASGGSVTITTTGTEDSLTLAPVSTAEDGATGGGSVQVSGDRVSVTSPRGSVVVAPGSVMVTADGQTLTVSSGSISMTGGGRSVMIGPGSISVTGPGSRSINIP